MPFDPDGWLSAVEETKSDEAPPDALYEVELVDTDIATRNSDGVQWITLAWKVIAGAQRDARWTSWHTLERFKADGDRNPGLGFTVQALRTMGLDVDNTRYGSEHELRSALATLEQSGYTVEVKRSGTFTNTYVKGKLDNVAPPSATTYGQEPARAAESTPGARSTGASAIYQGDGPEAQNGPTLADEGRAAVDPTPTGESDVPGAGAGDFVHPPQKGEIDPETGEPIPF